MRLTDIRKRIDVERHVATSIAHGLFIRDITLEDPYKCLAAGIIIQSLEDDCTVLEWLIEDGSNLSEEFKDKLRLQIATDAKDCQFYLDFVGIEIPYYELLFKAYRRYRRRFIRRRR